MYKKSAYVFMYANVFFSHGCMYAQYHKTTKGFWEIQTTCMVVISDN